MRIRTDGELLDAILNMDVEGEAEWERISKLTDAELDAEVRAEGLDPAKMAEDCRAVMLAAVEKYRAGR